MEILQVNIRFYDAVNIIYDVIITTNPYPYTAKFVFPVLEKHVMKINISDVER